MATFNVPAEVPVTFTLNEWTDILSYGKAKLRRNAGFYAWAERESAFAKEHGGKRTDGKDFDEAAVESEIKSRQHEDAIMRIFGCELAEEKK